MNKRLATLAACTLILFVAPQGSAATATSSTGDVDTWGISSFTCFVPQDTPSVKDPLGGGCLTKVCPDVFYTYAITLRLIDPSPGDLVSLAVAGETPAPVGGSISGGPTVNNIAADVATYSDPVAEVWVTVGGCRELVATVTGILVDGEVEYEISY